MTSNQEISPRAQEAEQILAREGRASRAMIAESLDVGGPRASELINQLLESGRAERIDTGLYEHQYFNHRFEPSQLEVARSLEQAADPRTNAGDQR